MEKQDLSALDLDVYESRPEHGELELPKDWEFLASGDTFVTKQVKAAGVYWNVWRPRGKNRPHRRPDEATVLCIVTAARVGTVRSP